MQNLLESFSYIFHFILNIVHYFASSISSGEPMVKGLVTVAIISSLVFLGKKLPKQLFYLLLRNVSTTVTYRKPIKSEESALESYAYDKFTSHLATLARTKFFTLDRKIQPSIGIKVTEEITFGVGNISGFFFLNRKLYFFDRIIEEGDKTTPLKDRVILMVMFGNKEDITVFFKSLFESDYFPTILKNGNPNYTIILERCQKMELSLVLKFHNQHLIKRTLT